MRGQWRAIQVVVGGQNHGVHASSKHALDDLIRLVRNEDLSRLIRIKGTGVTTKTQLALFIDTPAKHLA